ncbi:MAG: sialidase family protein [Candidatus Sumerlaeota bacterium]
MKEEHNSNLTMKMSDNENPDSRNRIVEKGADGSLVERIETMVILPAESSSALRIHPNLVVDPENRETMELSLRPTDRRGGDRHKGFDFYRTEDDFKTLEPVDSPSLPGWRWIGLEEDDVDDPENLIPENAEWHWARNAVPLDADKVLQPFMVREGDNRSVLTLIARRAEDGRLAVEHVSNRLENPVRRGLLEPQIAGHDDHYYMTMRAEDGRGYVSVSRDGGRSWEKPVAWAWEDGEKLEMTSTMSKLLPHSEGLLLVYTRVRDDNRDYFRQRTPLHCADVDPETLRLQRDSERIIVPNRSTRTGKGAKSLGNFWVETIDRTKSYVVVAEWPRDGSNQSGDTWLARIYWRQPNQRAEKNER